jgi:hypothetical protein
MTLERIKSQIMFVVFSWYIYEQIQKYWGRDRDEHIRPDSLAFIRLGGAIIVVILLIIIFVFE